VAAIRLGRHDDNGADCAFMHAFGFMLTLGIVLTAVSVPFHGGIAKLLGATEVYYEYVSDYLFWYSIFIIPASLNTLFQAFCRTDGSPMLVMAATIASSLANIFLDWLFVFPLHMGVSGAVAATGVSQVVAFFIVLSHFVLKKGELRFCRCRLQMPLIGKNVLRGIVFTSIVILLMPVIFGNEAIWYAFAVYEAISLILAIILVRISEKTGIIFK